MTVGQDLLDVYRGTMSLRRACMIFNNLPDGCALFRDMGGRRAWSVEAQLAVDQLYTAMIANWQRTKNGETGKDKPEYPEAPKSEAGRIAANKEAMEKEKAREAKIERAIKRQQERLNGAKATKE